MRWTRKSESAPEVERQPHYRDSHAVEFTVAIGTSWLQAERELQEKYNKGSRE